VNKRKTGEKWESYVATHLDRKGYRILHKNWTCRWGELDLIALSPSKECLVFIEVKYKQNRFGNPYESIGFHKIRSLKRSAQIYISTNIFRQKQFRFDVVTVAKFPGRVQLEHFEAVDQEW